MFVLLFLLLPLSPNLAFAEKHGGSEIFFLRSLELLSCYYYTHDVQWFAFINTVTPGTLALGYSVARDLSKIQQRSFRFNQPEYIVLSAESHKVSLKNILWITESKTFLCLKPNISSQSVAWVVCTEKFFTLLPYSCFWVLVKVATEGPRMTFWMWLLRGAWVSFLCTQLYIWM